MKKSFIFLFFCTLIFMGCSAAHTGPRPDDQSRIVSPVDYGNGVYFIDARDRDFAVSLSAFLSDTSRHLICVTGNGGADGAGDDHGYFVIIEQ